MAKLIFILDDEQEIEVPLPEQVTIGRQEGNDIVVDDPRISSTHAVVLRDPAGGYELRDLGSKAGTFINGSRVSRKHLEAGDKVSFGPLNCLFLAEETETTASPVATESGAVKLRPGHAEATGAGGVRTPGLETVAMTQGFVPAGGEEPRLKNNAFSPGGPSSKGPPRESPPPTKEEKSTEAPPAGGRASGVLRSILKTVEGFKPVDGGRRPAAPEPPGASQGAGELKKGTFEPVLDVVPPTSGKRVPSTAADVSHSGKSGSSKSGTSDSPPTMARTSGVPRPQAPVGGPEDGGNNKQIERVPVYTYAVQAKAQSGAPLVTEPRLGARPPAAPEKASAPSRPAPSEATPPAAPPAVVAAPHEAGGNSGGPSPGHPPEVSPLPPVVSSVHPAHPLVSRPSSDGSGMSAVARPDQMMEVRPNNSQMTEAQRAHASHLIKDLEGKQGELMQSLRQLTDQKHAVQSDIERQTAELLRVAGDFENVKKLIATSEGELRAIEREVQNRTNYLAQLAAKEEKLAHVAATLPEVEGRHSELARILQLLTERKEAGEADLRRISEEIQFRSARVAELKADEEGLARVTAALHEAEGRRADQLRTLQGLADQQAAMEADLRSLANELKNRQTILLNASEEINARTERIEMLQEDEEKLKHVSGALKAAEGRHMELLREVEHLRQECGDRKAEIRHLHSDASTAGQDLDAVRGRLRAADEQFHQVELQLRQTESQLQAVEAELRARTQRVEHLLSEEERLIQETDSLKGEETGLREAIKDAETTRQGWLGVIQALNLQHDQKQAEIQRLQTSVAGTLRELEAMTSNKEQMSVHLLSLLKEQESMDARIVHLRVQCDDLESKATGLKTLVEAREDQVRAAERRITDLDQDRVSLEQRIQNLAGTEEKLVAAQHQLIETQAKQNILNAEMASVTGRVQTEQAKATELDARVDELRKRLESIHVEITESRASLARDQRTHDEFRSEFARTRDRIESDKAVLEKQLEDLREDLNRDTQKLADARAEKEELDRKCQDLADIGARLITERETILQTENQRRALEIAFKELEGRHESLQQIVDGLHSDEEGTKGRLEVLRGREKDLRQTLEDLAEGERNDRERFEAIRRLTAEAEKEHSQQREELLSRLELTKRELADIEMKLTPLREWKECMDMRYARLASLPEDSQEARELWREIETEKSNLRNLITGAPGSTRGVSLSEAVLRGLSAQHPTVPATPAGFEESSSASGETETTEKAERPAPKVSMPPPVVSPKNEEASEDKVSTPGMGALISSTGQEMALKARITRLRESVQREATRLEFLRQERAREEARGKGGSPGESVLREQDRQLEVKVRREEARLATVQRKLELAEVEEEKRRERIAEMERRLAELRTDIVDAERNRNAARHHAEMAQAELRAQEQNADRQRHQGGNEGGTSVLAAIIASKSPRSGSKLKPMGSPES